MSITQEDLDELRRDIMEEHYRDTQHEVLMRRDEDFFGSEIEIYYNEHTVMETIEYIEHYDRDVDYWFDFLMEK